MSETLGLDTTIYKIVSNPEAQFSIWPAYKDNPTGWIELGFRGNRQECLAHICQTWTDMRPMSLREQMEQPQQQSEQEQSGVAIPEEIEH
ncbi:hypothetical protein BH11PSE11_BH11PSE11_03600 [soil metagenome]